jgi:hypothetical protein
MAPPLPLSPTPDPPVESISDCALAPEDFDIWRPFSCASSLSLLGNSSDHSPLPSELHVAFDVRPLALLANSPDGDLTPPTRPRFTPIACAAPPLPLVDSSTPRSGPSPAQELRELVNVYDTLREESATLQVPVVLDLLPSNVATPATTPTPQTPTPQTSSSRGPTPSQGPTSDHSSGFWDDGDAFFEAAGGPPDVSPPPPVDLYSPPAPEGFSPPVNSWDGPHQTGNSWADMDTESVTGWGAPATNWEAPEQTQFRHPGHQPTPSDTSVSDSMPPLEPIPEALEDAPPPGRSWDDALNSPWPYGHASPPPSVSDFGPENDADFLEWYARDRKGKGKGSRDSYRGPAPPVNHNLRSAGSSAPRYGTLGGTGYQRRDDPRQRVASDLHAFLPRPPRPSRPSNSSVNLRDPAIHRIMEQPRHTAYVNAIFLESRRGITHSRVMAHLRDGDSTLLDPCDNILLGNSARDSHRQARSELPFVIWTSTDQVPPFPPEWTPAGRTVRLSVMHASYSTSSVSLQLHSTPPAFRTSSP